jgi:hypothetical protein
MFGLFRSRRRKQLEALIHSMHEKLAACDERLASIELMLQIADEEIEKARGDTN